MEFRIEALPDAEFRTANTSPIDILAISSQVDFDQYTKTRDTLRFALEHIEVKAGSQWVPVKVADREVYMPMGIETNFRALNELCKWYVENVLVPVFQDSAE